MTGVQPPPRRRRSRPKRPSLADAPRHRGRVPPRPLPRPPSSPPWPLRRPQQPHRHRHRPPPPRPLRDLPVQPPRRGGVQECPPLASPKRHQPPLLQQVVEGATAAEATEGSEVPETTRSLLRAELTDLPTLTRTFLLPCRRHRSPSPRGPTCLPRYHRQRGVGMEVATGAPCHPVSRFHPLLSAQSLKT